MSGTLGTDPPEAPRVILVNIFAVLLKFCYDRFLFNDIIFVKFEFLEISFYTHFTLMLNEQNVFVVVCYNITFCMHVFSQVTEATPLTKGDKFRQH